MIVGGTVPHGYRYVLWNATYKKWEDNPNTYRYFFGAEADPVSEKEAAMWAVHLGTTLEDAYALLTE